MEKHFIVTKDTIKNAKTYMPLYSKVEIAKDIAERCVEKTKTAKQNQEGLKFLPLPEIKVENLVLKNILLLNVLLNYYLNIELDEKQDIYEQYDYFAGGNILNQIERFKSDYDLKDIVFDLLGDYKDFKKIVDTEIFNVKANCNDTIARLSAIIEVMSTPENVKAMTEALNKSVEELQEKQKAIKNKIAEQKEESKVNE